MTYYDSLLYVLKNLGIVEAKQEHHNKMLFPSIIRNSLHSNGIINDNEKEVKGKIKNIKFIFRKDEAVSYGTYLRISFFLDCIVDVIELILEKLEGVDHIESIFRKHIDENN